MFTLVEQVRGTVDEITADRDRFAAALEAILDHAEDAEMPAVLRVAAIREAAYVALAGGLEEDAARF